jgi:hypothetical protein
MIMVMTCGGRQDERAVGREEHHPRDQRADDRDRDADADPAEQPGKQDRGKEGHRAEALADASEQPPKHRREGKECRAGGEAQARPVARQSPKRGCELGHFIYLPRRQAP